MKKALNKPDLELENLYIQLGNDAPAMVVLRALSDGRDPYKTLQESFVNKELSVLFGEGGQVSIRTNEMILIGRFQGEYFTAETLKPANDITGIGLVVRVREVTVGREERKSSAERILQWGKALESGKTAPEVFLALKLTEELAKAEKARSIEAGVRFNGVERFYRCRKCKGIAKGAERCPLCKEERERPLQVGRLELMVIPSEKIKQEIEKSGSVQMEFLDGEQTFGKVIGVDRKRGVIQVAVKGRCSLEENEGILIPAFNRMLAMAKRKALVAIAEGEVELGLVSELLTNPAGIKAPEKRQFRGEWKTAGMQRDGVQEQAVEMIEELSPGACMAIQGPPGTGKTTVIVEAIKRILARDATVQILVTSHSNLAVDHALERLKGTPHFKGVRVAKAERVAEGLEEFVAEEDEEEKFRDANCFFATCATAATASMLTGRFDLVILDEANKVRVDEAIPVLVKGRAIVLVGDHKQLPPVEEDILYELEEKDPLLEKIIDTSFFEEIWDRGLPGRVMLKVQHRMHPEISRYISKASYQGELQDAPEILKYQYVGRQPLPAALHFVNTAGLRGKKERRGPGGAIVNEMEIKVALAAVKFLDRTLAPELSLAVIAMYAEQVERLRVAIGRRGFRRVIKVDTVDAFEGREEDVVVISLVRSNTRGRIGFLRAKQRLNVAVSRAKRMCVVIGDAVTLRIGEESMYGVLVEEARSNGGLVPAALLLRRNHGRQAQRRRREWWMKHRNGRSVQGDNLNKEMKQEVQLTTQEEGV